MSRGTKFHGKPCKHGHGTLRYVSNRMCVICQCNWSCKHTIEFKVVHGRPFRPRQDVQPNSRYWARWLINAVHEEMRHAS